MTAATTVAEKIERVAKPQAATALSRADHKLVSGQLGDHENARSATTKKNLVAQIRTELTVHAPPSEGWVLDDLVSVLIIPITVGYGLTMEMSMVTIFGETLTRFLQM